MKQFIHVYSSQQQLFEFLQQKDIQTLSATCSDVLIQIYSPLNQETVRSVSRYLLTMLPRAQIIGSSSVGEIAHGLTVTGTILLAFTFFEISRIQVIAKTVPAHHEVSAAQIMATEIRTNPYIRGAMLLTTPIAIDVARFLYAFRSSSGIETLFGSGAADNGLMLNSWLIHQSEIIHSGIIIIVFSGKNLEIDLRLSYGWIPLGKKMTITETAHRVVTTMDHQPARQLYESYIGKVEDDDFGVIGAMFALLMDRNDSIIPRVTMKKSEQKLHFLADVYLGEQFSIGIGDPQQMFLESNQACVSLNDFMPQAVFLFCCGIRRLLMQDLAHLETEFFDSLAPSVGYYTYGEIYSDQYQTQLLNGTLVIAGMKENNASLIDKSRLMTSQIIQTQTNYRDPYAKQHAQILSRLLHLTQAITRDLENTNKELFTQSITDKLTSLFNRAELDRQLFQEIHRATRYGAPLSLIMLDIDDFKQVNDRFGHITGDTVLIHTAHLIKENIRNTDIAGRWGGEEFLVIAPHTYTTDAVQLAEKIRSVIENQPLLNVDRQTVSLGIATLQPTDSAQTLLKRADIALYAAKHAGKNQVKVSLGDETTFHADKHILQLSWHDDFCCGIPEIDREHQALFNEANQVMSSILMGRSRKMIHSELTKFIQHIDAHQAHETEIINLTGYQNDADHIDIHLQLSQRLKEHFVNYKKEKISASQLLQFIIHQVIYEHMLEWDKRFFSSQDMAK